MTLILNLLKETLLALILKISWKVVLERALTRGVIGGLRWLAKLTTNTLDDATVEDIITNLQGKKLKVADETPINKATEPTRVDWSE